MIDRAKLHLVDTFAAIVSGTRLRPREKAIDYVKTLGGKPEAGVTGTRMVVSATHAALANGMFGHADATDAPAVADAPGHERRAGCAGDR